MTSSTPFQTLLEFSESYLSRPLLPEERAKLQNFYNKMVLRQNARQASAWHKREIQQRVHETLMQLLAQVRQGLEENFRQSTKKNEDGASGPAENSPEPSPEAPSESIAIANEALPNAVPEQ
jgi:hypothetical protein